MDDDPELAAIRARLRQEMLGQAEAGGPPATQPLDHPVDVTDAEFAPFVASHRLVLVDVWAPWCGPCRIVGPVIEQLAREMAGRVTFAKVNADENRGVMDAFGIQGIPTLLLFRDGRLVDRLVGAYPRPQLAAWLERHAARGAGAPGPRR